MALLSGCHSGQASQTEKPLVKVCGITAPGELDVLRAHRVDLVGLWWGVPGGPHDLDRERWATLAQAAADTGVLAPVLVTFAKDPEELRATLQKIGRAHV